MAKTHPIDRLIAEMAASFCQVGAIDDQELDDMMKRPEVQVAAAELHDDGEISTLIFRKITARDVAMPARLDPLLPAEIARVRQATGVSQAVFASALNVSKILVSKWERGERKPSGAALRLLTIVKTRGLDAIR